MTLDSISHKMFLVPLLHYPQIMFNFKFSKTGLFLNLNFILMAKSTYSMKDLKISLYSFVDPLLLRPFLLRFRKKQWLAPWIYLTFTVWDSISNQRGELFWLQNPNLQGLWSSHIPSHTGEFHCVCTALIFICCHWSYYWRQHRFKMSLALKAKIKVSWDSLH